ncbi:ankyrin [Piromyces finnis]|uniref:Ankyrin n=1 Tax=Piromyces finnis TaxID=1754191 RepID=A0A1Y1UY38_9FUNG|nr:ankyrin [Piromyces finnis]|eukprot:ORX42663.1 ankyrin [Piromyces finnis]
MDNNYNNQDNNEIPYLHYAYKNNYINILKRLITKNNESINARDNKGNTLLHIACQKGDKDIVKCLVDNGANIFIQNNNGDIPITLAKKNDDKDIISLLNTENENILFLREAIKKIGIKENIKSIQVISIIHPFKNTSNTNERKININTQNSKGLTLLHYACEQGNENIVKYLIKKGADTNIKSSNGGISLHYACKSKNDNVNLVKYLIEAIGLDINIKDRHEKIPFHYACYKGNENIVKYLIKNGVDPRIKNDYGRMSLHFVCGAEKENINLVKYLIEDIGLDINIQNKDGCTPLHYACEQGNENIVKYLIEKGADTSIKNNNGRISLHCTCKAKRESVNIVKYLIEKRGLNINIKDNYRFTPIHYACYKGNENIVKYLIKNGVDPKIKNEDGRISLHFACGAEKENVNLVKYLIEDIGLDINTQNKDGCTPLHYACEQGNENIVKYLIENKIK